MVKLGITFLCVLGEQIKSLEKNQCLFGLGSTLGERKKQALKTETDLSILKDEQVPFTYIIFDGVCGSGPS